MSKRALAVRSGIASIVVPPLNTIQQQEKSTLGGSHDENTAQYFHDLSHSDCLSST